ncbi:MAG: sugar ABC transporter ATP-binding protein [Bdellovibrionaceae bacterium]|nr:sugar ABC transporter ATP-binding protein [Pseudobdellovibrionaceae bacterium]
MGSTILSFKNVRKAFGGVYALSGVSFDVEKGECLALVGENGAGKSTLMKILSGVWPAGSYEGEVVFEGRVLSHKNPMDAREAGISIIHQELCLFPQLSVAENLFLSEAYPYEGKASSRLASRVRWRTLYEHAEALMNDLGFDIPVRALVKDLSVAERQLVEVARAFHQNATLLVLDEPTSALSQAEVERLFDVLRRMKGKLTFIYISHKLEEVFALCDRILVLRDGQSVGMLKTAETNTEEVIRHMVGRPLKLAQKEVSLKEGAPILSVKNLSHYDLAGSAKLEGISFDLYPREILGIAGLMGSGRSELLRSLIGVLPGTRQGEIFFQGKAVEWNGIREALADGVAFVPEDRKKDGLFLDHSIEFNGTISVLNKFTRAGLLKLEDEDRFAEGIFEQLHVKYADGADPIKVLSGGNQQKVLLAKMVATQPKVLLLDEPTRGIDIGAKEEIYQIIRELVRDGISVIVVSSELPEVLGLSDRVLVLREGESRGLLINQNLTQEKVMACAAGEA